MREFRFPVFPESQKTLLSWSNQLSSAGFILSENIKSGIWLPNVRHSFTTTNPNNSRFYYIQLGNAVLFSCYYTAAITGGTAGAYFEIDLPVGRVLPPDHGLTLPDFAQRLCCWIFQNGLTLVPGLCQIEDSYMRFYKDDLSNFTVSASDVAVAGFAVNGFYFLDTPLA